LRHLAAMCKQKCVRLRWHLYISNTEVSSSHCLAASCLRAAHESLAEHRKGHSITVVGIERQSSSKRSLLVLDPMFQDPNSISRYIGGKHSRRNPDKALRLYRRGAKYLKKYDEFEILR
jgi:hypothetical protein